jgi:hypothetical protein
MLPNRFKYGPHDIANNLVRPGTSHSGYNFHDRSSTDFHFWGKYTPFFIKPCLKIARGESEELSDLRWSKNEDVVYPRRRFIRVIVENTGRSPAMQCQAKLNVHDHTDKCRALSESDTKILLWQNKDTKIDIGARYDKSFFELAFSQEKLTENQMAMTDPVYCGIVNNKVRVQSWISTKAALEQPENRDQDGMCRGRFRVHVEVFTINGEKTVSDFIIKVGDNWHALEATKVECNSMKKSIVERVSERVFCRSPK